MQRQRKRHRKTAPKQYWHIPNICYLGKFLNVPSLPFLGPRGPHGIPLSVSPQEKFGSHIYRHICLKNHLKTHQTNLMAPWDPLNVPLTPWDLLPMITSSRGPILYQFGFVLFVLILSLFPVVLGTKRLLSHYFTIFAPKKLYRGRSK